MSQPLTGKGWEDNSPYEQAVLKLPCFGLSQSHNKRFGNVDVPLVKYGRAFLGLAWTCIETQSKPHVRKSQWDSVVEDPLLVVQILLEIGPWTEFLTFASCLSQTVTSSFLFLMDWWGCLLWESGPVENRAVCAPWRKFSEELPSKWEDAEDCKLTPCPI